MLRSEYHVLDDYMILQNALQKNASIPVSFSVGDGSFRAVENELLTISNQYCKYLVATHDGLSSDKLTKLSIMMPNVSYMELYNDLAYLKNIPRADYIKMLEYMKTSGYFARIVVPIDIVKGLTIEDIVKNPILSGKDGAIIDIIDLV